MPELFHVIESQQFVPELIEELFSMADNLEPKATKDLLQGKILCSLFYEESTRTRWSFEVAMLRLGGSYISTENASHFSSVAKGESLKDTVRILNGYVDVIVLRHPKEKSAEEAASVAEVPLINGGNGTAQHPTQALLDLYTIRCKLGRVNNLTVTMIGDLSRGRTVRSLCYLLSKYPGNRIFFLSPESLKMNDDIKAHLSEHNTDFEEHFELHHPALALADVIYDTRVQTNRDKDAQSAEKLLEESKNFALTADHLGLLKRNAIVMHPLPRIEGPYCELKIDPEDDERIVYIKQANYFGLKIRMALLLKVLGKSL